MAGDPIDVVPHLELLAAHMSSGGDDPDGMRAWAASRGAHELTVARERIATLEAMDCTCSPGNYTANPPQDAEWDPMCDHHGQLVSRVRELTDLLGDAEPYISDGFRALQVRAYLGLPE